MTDDTRGAGTPAAGAPPPCPDSQFHWDGGTDDAGARPGGEDQHTDCATLEDVKREVFCRVFDDFDAAHEEWAAWYKPSDWLWWGRALGAFIYQRQRRDAAALRGATPAGGGGEDAANDTGLRRLRAAVFAEVLARWNDGTLDAQMLQNWLESESAKGDRARPSGGEWRTDDRVRQWRLLMSNGFHEEAELDGLCDDVWAAALRASAAPPGEGAASEREQALDEVARLLDTEETKMDAIGRTDLAGAAAYHARLVRALPAAPLQGSGEREEGERT